MASFTVGVLVGSARNGSINQKLANALAKLGNGDVEYKPIKIDDLPLFNQDLEATPPASVERLCSEIRAADGLLFVTPEYNRSIPGVLKNAVDWASRPWGENSFNEIPAAVIGASPGSLGTALAQQSMRGVLSYCNARQMTAPEAYINYSPDRFGPDGEVLDDSVREFLTEFMREFRDYIERVLTVLPRRDGEASS